MIRLIYQCLLYLHPPAFRRRFGAEMLWIFDQEPSARCAADAFLSLLRQWVLRSSLWKIAAAGIGAYLTLTAALGVMPRPPRGLDNTSLNSPTGFFILMALTCLMVVAFTLTLCVLWFRFSRRRRA